MVRQLIVLHESAVDDGNAQIDVEQNRHRLQLAYDDVAEDAYEWKDSFGVRHPAGPLPFLEQPLERSLKNHARHADRVQHHEERHTGSTEPSVDGHLVTRGDGEGDGLRISVQEVDVARSARERAWGMDAIADVLHAVRCIAGDNLARCLVVESKRRNSSVLAVEHPGLTIRRRRWEPAEPAPECESFAHQPRDRRTKTQFEGAPEIGVSERIDLKHDEPTLRWARTLLSREQAVLGAVVSLEQWSGAGMRAAFRYARWCSI